jgi:hypothetical protein
MSENNRRLLLFMNRLDRIRQSFGEHRNQAWTLLRTRTLHTNTDTHWAIRSGFLIELIKAALFFRGRERTGLERIHHRMLMQSLAVSNRSIIPQLFPSKRRTNHLSHRRRNLGLFNSSHIHRSSRWAFAFYAFYEFCATAKMYRVSG